MGAAGDAVRGVVDSILPVEEEIRRFRTAVGTLRTSTLARSADSREQLVQQVVTALAHRDTATLKSTLINASEFIDLYYPSTRYTKPPYRQSAAFVWFLIQQNSQKGMARALARFGGHQFRYIGSDCKQGEDQGENRFWECGVRFEGPAGEQQTVRLFGSVMERNGRFKLVSFSNDL